jgi:tRNA threonylcarbamoyladenosine biosynthesis protein TsaB
VLILSLDTTTRAGSAAVLRDDAVLAVAEGDASHTHGERLPGELDAVLQAAGVALADIELLTVARGPGAFTGLRIGLAAMQGVAMVTGRPVVGVSALDALAVAAFDQLKVPRARIGAWMDAARGEVFAAAYDVSGEVGGVPVLTPLGEPEVDGPEAVWRRWQGASHVDAADSTVEHAHGPWVFIGDGAGVYRSHLPALTVVPVPPLAPVIARIGRRQVGSGHHDPHGLQPLYVRRPDAERGPHP